MVHSSTSNYRQNHKPQAMKNETIKTEWSLRSCFEQMRDANGDVILTEKDQEEIIRLTEGREKKWIKCSEGMPEEATPVVICTTDGYLAMASLELYGGRIRWSWEHESWFLSEVTHWMPLSNRP